MAKNSQEKSLPQRPRVLLLAASCNPFKGSESAAGWGRAVESAKKNETWVICGHWDQPDIARYLNEHGEIPGLHFSFVKKSRVEELLKLGRPLYELHYLPYNLWHRRAFKLAARLHRELKFDLIHQVCIIGFREPGYLWKLDAPFIWGPVGGTQNYPGQFLKAAGFLGTLKEGCRSIINVLQFRFSPRVRQALKRSAVLIAANAAIQKDFERVHGIKPPVLLEIGINNVAPRPAKITAPHNPVRILWSGQFKHHKALHLLLQALSLMPADFHYDLKILGDGPLKKRWQALARRLGIEAHCQWPGWIPHELALKEYGWADVFVITSLRDVNPNVVLEALGAGLPIICLDHQGVGDIVTDACGIKIPVTTPEEVIAKLRDHLVSLTSDQVRLASLSRGALKRAGQFLWSGNGNQMARIYALALQARRIDGPKDQDCPDVERSILGSR
jgi:glycosyltransferase involved in cell wall biosynthesis